MQINSSAKCIINRKTMHKTYYRCNICIDTYTYTFPTALSAQILMVQVINQSAWLKSVTVINYSFH